jgi:hypothetical protein
MNEALFDAVTATPATDANSSGECLFTLEPHEELFFPKHKRLVAQYSAGESGRRELHLYYGEKDIVFDEPELFAFGESLARQPRFIAGDALRWDEHLEWPQVREMLEHLLDEQILLRAAADDAHTAGGARPSLLPKSQCRTPRTWFECAAITQELTGRALEVGYLELLIPIYRVAHIALDRDGRQVGEANVFPSQLRLDIPTDWRACPHPGSRYQDDCPMNVTALKAMREHWKPMMVVLSRIRQAFVQRYPHVAHGWTVGDLERLSALVLTVPALLLMRMQGTVPNGALHPVLSSMYRVTDGVRLTMHHMMFVSLNEPVRAPEAPMTSTEIYAYADRNAVFLSDYGVCAGPKAMIEEFLGVLVDGRTIEGMDSVVLDAELKATLSELDRAFDYGLYGLQANAVMFAYPSLVARCYQRIAAIAESWPSAPSQTLQAFFTRVRANTQFLANNSLVATEADRRIRERVYENFFANCAQGLAHPTAATLPECIAPARLAQHDAIAEQLYTVLKTRMTTVSTFDDEAVKHLAAALLDWLQREQALVRAGCEIQTRINQLLGRSAPLRPFTSADIYLYYLFDERDRRVPCLLHDVEQGLGLRIIVTQDSIAIHDGAER